MSFIRKHIATPSIAPSQASYDVVIIGSGFGGAVCALRLAQKNKSVCILERGRRWEKEDFAHSEEDLPKLFWNHEQCGLFHCRKIGSDKVGGGTCHGSSRTPVAWSVPRQGLAS